MSRILASRIAKLEAKRKANEVPMRELGSFASKPLWRVEESDGVLRGVPLFTSDEYADFARKQQSALLAELNEKVIELEAEETHVGKSEGLAPILPGQKRPNFIYINEGGKEVQIEIATGRKAVV